MDARFEGLEESYLRVVEKYEQLQATADRRLELLREIDRDVGFCIVCKSREIDWAGLKVHKDDCRLVKELSDATLGG